MVVCTRFLWPCFFSFPSNDLHLLFFVLGGCNFRRVVPDQNNMQPNRLFGSDVAFVWNLILA